MTKQLHEFTKEELIGIIQDYQEMVNEIEGICQDHMECCVPDTLFMIKESIGHWVHKDARLPTDSERCP